MKCSLLAGVGLVAAHAVSPAQLHVMPGRERECVFGGGERIVNVLISNRSDAAAHVVTRLALHQTSSATTARIGESPWKTLSVLPGQTVVESARIAFPAVKARTRFLIHWLDDANTGLGVAEVLAYPTNLLAELKPLAGGEPLGVFDPGNELKPLLRAQSVAFQDLIEDGTDKFFGRLAVFGPFASAWQVRASLAKDIRALAERGVAVVWLQPPSKPHAPLKPSFYAMRVGDGAVVVAQDELVSRLADNPEAQLNLIRLAEEALQPAPLELPETETEN